MTFLLILGSILGLIYVYHLLTRKYLNPYKLTMCFGKKGSGKTTLLTKLALYYQKRGIPVYCTEPIVGCFLVEPTDIGFSMIPPNSVLLIDEVGMVWDKRNFKDFKPEVRNWFKLQRHYKVSVFMYSQTFDVDVKLRDLTDEMYFVENKFRVFSYSKRIIKRMVLVKPSADAPSKMDEELIFDSFLWFWCGSRKLTFIPKYVKYFDSFCVPPLPEKEFPYIPLALPDSLQAPPSVFTRLWDRFRKVSDEISVNCGDDEDGDEGGGL